MEKDDFSYLSASLEDFLKEARFSSSVTKVDQADEKTSILATVGITGELVGYLTLSMDHKNGLTLSKRFAELMEIPIASNDFSDQHMEALAELSNQISGRVVMHMEEEGINCSITPPSVMSGGDISFSLKSLKTHRLYRVDGDHGFFYVSIGIK